MFKTTWTVSGTQGAVLHTMLFSVVMYLRGFLATIAAVLRAALQALESLQKQLLDGVSV